MGTLAARRGIAPVEFILVVAPSAALLAAVLVAPAWAADPTMDRIRNTIWLTTALLIPALCLYAVPAYSPTDRPRRYALLFYTSAFAAFLAHFWYTVFVHFGGFSQTVHGMRSPAIAYTNFVLTACWAVDLLLAWGVASPPTWVRGVRFLAMAFLYAVFVATELFLRPTAIRYLGMALAVLVPLCLLARLRPGRRASATTP